MNTRAALRFITDASSQPKAKHCNGRQLYQDKDNKASIHSSYGFTLLEILATIVISAILAVILVQVMGTQSGRSYYAIAAYDDSLALKTAVENITADHRYLTQFHATPLIQLQNNLNGEGGFSGYWDPAEPITATHYCVELTPAADESLGLVESNQRNVCSISDTILKVKLHNGNQSLVTLFTLQ